jgi:hypothetical protein
VFHDDLGRTWQGPFAFSVLSVRQNVPTGIFGVYQVLSMAQTPPVVAYIGIATGDTIAGRLTKHATDRGNWALGRLGDPSKFAFVFYECDAQSAAQIESWVVTNAKPPFNVRPELKNLIPSIAVH